METLQAFSLRQACLDEFCIEAFQIRQDDELDEVGGIADISPCIGVLNVSNSTLLDVLTFMSFARGIVVICADDLADGNLGSGGGGEDLLADAGSGVIFPRTGV